MALDLTFDGTPEQLIDFLTAKAPKRLGTDKVDCILQEAIEGDVVELSREGWRLPDGKMVHPNSTFENKKLHSRDSGPRVGCAVSTVWRDADFSGVSHKQLAKAAKLLGDYMGAMDANCIITPDLQGLVFGVDPAVRLQRPLPPALLHHARQARQLLPGSVHTIWKEGFVASQVLSLFPFPPTAITPPDFAEMIPGNLISHKIDEKDFGGWTSWRTPTAISGWPAPTASSA